MLKHLIRLEIAEYIAVDGAGTGTILATIFQQFTWAAWSLCFAILLNTINRRYGLNQDWHSRHQLPQLEEKIATLTRHIDLAKVQSPAQFSAQFNSRSNAESPN